MKKIFILVLCLSMRAFAADVHLDAISDDRVKEYILIQNNAMRCFEPELWFNGSLNDKEKFVEQHSMKLLRYDFALMSELFGVETAVSIMEERENAAVVFNQKLQQLSHKNISIQSDEDCRKLSDYFAEILEKY